MWPRRILEARGFAREAPDFRSAQSALTTPGLGAGAAVVAKRTGQPGVAVTICGMDLPLIGVDFSSAPSKRKPVLLAQGRLQMAGSSALLRLDGLQRFETLAAFGDWLGRPGPWIGGFDLPFGLPRELVQQLGWPTDWAACMDFYCAQPRPWLREAFVAFCAARPVGAKFAHRACDGPAGSSPSMKWVNPPVAWMLHAGVPLLRAAGVHLPAHEDGVAEGRQEGQQEGQRVALEAYPGLLARELLGARSYKSDDKARQTAERLIARKDLIEALEQGRSQRLQGLRLKLSAAQRDALAADASGDSLDAVLCLLQAGWAAQRPGYGLPADLDRLEGWILSAG